MIKQLYAIKSHMEQAFVNGRRVPVTCLLVPEHAVVAQKTNSVLLSIGKKKPTARKSLQGFLKKLNLGYTPRYFREVEAEGEITPDPQEIDLTPLLEVGKNISVTAISKGKGFSGVIKRWNFSTQPRTHGQSDRHRAPGSIARGTTPGRVVKGKHMAGRMGGDLKNVANLSIISYDPTTRLLKVSGPTPGSRNTLTKIAL